MSHEIRAEDPDPRKIPWLWAATISVVVANKNPKGEDYAPESMSTAWKSLLYFPQDMKGFECWREVTEVTSGEHFRVHFGKSEWTEEFRTTVVLAWTPIIKQHRDSAESGRWDDELESAQLAQRKIDFGRKFEITPAELDEILKATE